MYYILIIILFFNLFLSGCKENPQEIENERIRKIQENYKSQIKEDYTIPFSYPDRVKAVTAFLYEINQKKDLNSICNEKESKEIFFPNSYNTNSLISYEEPNKAWEIVSTRRYYGIETLKKKLQDVVIKDIKIEWKKEVRDLNSLKGHVVQNIIVITSNDSIELEEIKLVIEHKNQFKVCVVSR